MKKANQPLFALLRWPLFWAVITAVAYLVLYHNNPVPQVSSFKFFNANRFQLFGWPLSLSLPFAISRLWDIFFVPAFLLVFFIGNDGIKSLTIKRANVKDVFWASAAVGIIAAYYAGGVIVILLAVFFDLAIVIGYFKNNCRYATLLGFNAAAGFLLGLGLIQGFGFSFLLIFPFVMLSGFILGFSLLFKNHDATGW
jgi:hypothetical protein